MTQPKHQSHLKHSFPHPPENEQGTPLPPNKKSPGINRPTCSHLHRSNAHPPASSKAARHTACGAILDTQKNHSEAITDA
jgi:hypothetical protein